MVFECGVVKIVVERLGFFIFFIVVWWLLRLMGL